jgi:hypothetical protein
LRNLRPQDKETRLYLNRELCEIAFTFPFIVEPKGGFFEQVKNNPIDWVKVSIIPEHAALIMEQSLGKI